MAKVTKRGKRCFTIKFDSTPEDQIFAREFIEGLANKPGAMGRPPEICGNTTDAPAPATQASKEAKTQG